MSVYKVSSENRWLQGSSLWNYSFSGYHDATTVIFEPDEEGGYRALAPQPVPVDLLHVVAEKLATLYS